MLRMRKIQKQYDGPVCRACLNEMTAVHLRRKNCRYVPGAGICPRCQNAGKHLVDGLKLSGRLKTLFR